MISILQPIHSGNAVRVFLAPTDGATSWKLLRNSSGTFTGHNDPGALLVYEGDERVILDHKHLQNEVPQFWCPFYTSDGATWTAGPVVPGIARAIYQDQTTDVMQELRDRLEAGLLVECQRGNFVTELGMIQVYAAQPSIERDVRLPMVTLHLDSEDPAERFIGDEIATDLLTGDDWEESEGWLASVRLSIVGWSLNGDERIELRKAIRRIVIANLTVFEGLGFSQVSLRQEDNDAVNGEYPAQIYQTIGTFTCLAPVRVAGFVPAISDVISRSV